MREVNVRIFLLYSGNFGVEIGGRVCRSLREYLGREFHVAQTTWNAGLLKSPKLRIFAAKEAMDSDIVLVAMPEGVPLDREMVEWLEMWKNRFRAAPAALVALLKRDDSNSPNHVEQSLARVAESARMDFFVRPAGHACLRIRRPSGPGRLNGK